MENSDDFIFDELMNIAAETDTNVSLSIDKRDVVNDIWVNNRVITGEDYSIPTKEYLGTFKYIKNLQFDEHFLIGLATVLLLSEYEFGVYDIAQLWGNKEYFFSKLPNDIDIQRLKDVMLSSIEAYFNNWNKVIFDNINDGVLNIDSILLSNDISPYEKMIYWMTFLGALKLNEYVDVLKIWIIFRFANPKVKYDVN